jgi:predicted Zn-dependent protease
VSVDESVRADEVGIDPAAVRDALREFGAGTRLDVSGERIGLLRYACSRVITQHSERRLRVRVRVTRDGRVASGALESLAAPEVRALAGRLADALAVLPKCESDRVDTRPVAREAVPPQVSEATLRAGAAERYAWFDGVRTGLGDRLQLGGAARHSVIERIVADTDGLFQAETLTRASFQAIADAGGRSASVRLLDWDSARIEVDGVADRLRAELAPLPTREKFAGTCRVVLRPQAAITLLATYGYAALGAAGYADGRTAVAGRLGEQVVSDLLTLVDDGADPDGLPSGFDVEGTPRRRTSLIENGVLTGVVSNLEQAAVTGGASTGHGVPLGWRFGAEPAPSHLLLRSGEATEADLLAGCEDGLVVSRLDYLRVLHPKDTLVTGTTRDATFWVRGGRIVAWHPQVRLTFRMDEVLRAVLAVGRDRERGEAPFMESVVAPTLLIDAGPFVLGGAGD